MVARSGKHQGKGTNLWGRPHGFSRNRIPALERVEEFCRGPTSGPGSIAWATRAHSARRPNRLMKNWRIPIGVILSAAQKSIFLNQLHIIHFVVDDKETFIQQPAKLFPSRPGFHGVVVQFHGQALAE